MNNINNLRYRKNISQKELGKAVGISESAISRYENGICHPSEDVTRRLADYFRTTPSYLMLRTSSYYGSRTVLPISLLSTMLSETCIVEINDDNDTFLFRGTPSNIPSYLQHRLCLFIRPNDYNYITITVTAK